MSSFSADFYNNIEKNVSEMKDYEVLYVLEVRFIQYDKKVVFYFFRKQLFLSFNICYEGNMGMFFQNSDWPLFCYVISK